MDRNLGDTYFYLKKRSFSSWFDVGRDDCRTHSLAYYFSILVSNEIIEMFLLQKRGFHSYDTDCLGPLTRP